MIEEGSFLNFSKTSYDPLECKFEKCGKIILKQMNYNQIHSDFLSKEEDVEEVIDEEKPEFFNWNKWDDKIFKPKVCCLF